MRHRALAIATICALGVISEAQTFNWENLDIGTPASVAQAASGVTATATPHLGGDVIVVSDLSSTLPLFFSRSISADDTFNAGSSPLRIEFSTIVSFLYVEFGDGDPDDDGLVSITAYNMFDSEVATNSFSFGTNTGIGSLTLNAPNISYILTSSVSGLNTMFYDNISVTPVPEPVSLIALGAGFAALLARRRKRV